MSTVGQQLADFYSIDGETISEIAHNFNTYERNLQLKDPDKFFSLLTPKTIRQELFRIRLMRKYKHYRGMLNVLLEGRKSSRETLKDTGFIISLMDTEAEKFVQFVLSKLSYSLRTILINKFGFLIEDETRGFCLYKAVLKLYGLKIASPLLVACGEDVITDAILINEVKFRDRALLKCYRKSAKILEVYFRENNNFNKYPKLGRYLSKHDINLFHTLTSYGVPNIEKNAIIQYIRLYKDDFIKRGSEMKTLLRKDVLRKCFQEEDYVELYKNFLPSEFVIDWNLKRYLLMIPYEIRGRVIFKAFKLLHGYELYSSADPPDELLEMISLEDRRKFNLDTRVHYGSIKELAGLQHQLELASQVNVRHGLILKILMCCKVDDDLSELLEVLRTFVRMQMNEDQIVRFAFIESLVRNFSFYQFSSKHWDCIDEIIMNFHINDELISSMGILLQAYIEYRIRNGMDYYLQLKFFYEVQQPHILPTFSTNPLEQREVIIKFDSLIGEVYKDQLRYKAANIAIAITIIFFNRKHANFKLPLSEFKKSLKYALEDYVLVHYDFVNMKELLDCLSKEESDVGDLLDETFAACCAKDNAYTQIWFLRKHPDVIERNIVELFKHNALHYRFCYELCKLEGCSLQKKIIKYAHDIFAEAKPHPNRICTSLKLLAFYTDVNLDMHVAIDRKIDVHKEDMKELLEIQKVLISSYKFHPHTSGVITKIIDFADGDYLPFTLESLRYIFNNIPEIQLLDPIKLLISREVFVRTHTLHLMTNILSLQNNHQILNQLTVTERNVSVKKIILKKLFKSVLNNRTYDDWILFSANLQKLLDPQDGEIINEFFASGRIPKEFYIEFILLLWKQLSLHDNRRKFYLLDKIDEKKIDFCDIRCEKIIRESLFNPDNKFIERSYVFAYKYLISYPVNVEVDSARFMDDVSTVSEANQEYGNYCTTPTTETNDFIHSTMWKKVEYLWTCIHQASMKNDSYKFQKQLHEFFTLICTQSINANTSRASKLISNNERLPKAPDFDNSIELVLLKTMLKLIKQLNIPEHDKFEFTNLLKTTLFVLSANTDSFSKFVVENLRQLLSEFGPGIINIYSDIISDFVKLYRPRNSEECLLNLIEELSKRYFSTETKSFCVRLLPNNVPKNEVLRGKYLNLLKTFEVDSSEIIRLEVSNLLRKLYF